MVLFVTISSNNIYETKADLGKKKFDFKTIEETYVECTINEKKKKWTEYKLEEELKNRKHDVICLNRKKYDFFKKKCETGFSFLKEGEAYYTSKEKVGKRDFKIIRENLKNSPPVQIAFCGILVTLIIGLLEMKNKKFKN